MKTILVAVRLADGTKQMFEVDDCVDHHHAQKVVRESFPGSVRAALALIPGEAKQ
jgi:hypothetical protein